MNLFLLQKDDQGPVSVLAQILQIVLCGAFIFLTISCNAPVTSGTSDMTNGARSSASSTGNISGNYQASKTCKNCHTHIYDQFNESMHANSFKNPVFNAEFYKILLPRFENGEDLSDEVGSCIACHSPVTHILNSGNISSVKSVAQDLSGVECDLCHTITGFKGSKPEGGNYISKPGEQKLGPFQYKSDHHRAYSELQTKSEICAICHNRTNRFGLEIISTFSEWKRSQYAKRGIECQSCHMNVKGFLTAGQPVYESGEAAQATLIKPKNRSKIYTHRFPGAHSESQVNGAIQLDIQVDEPAVEAGKETMIYVNVDNSRSGHKLPTGSAELRLLYLDLIAEVDGKTIPLSANSLDKEKYDISGKGKFDAIILRNDIPAGNRLYRAICLDEEGQQTVLSFDAMKIAFDNRLQASEIRKEFFTFQVPDDVGAEFFLVATLNYLRYPSSFADKLGVPKAKIVELANVRKKVVLSRHQ